MFGSLARLANAIWECYSPPAYFDAVALMEQNRRPTAEEQYHIDDYSERVLKANRRFLSSGTYYPADSLWRGNKPK